MSSNFPSSTTPIPATLPGLDASPSDNPRMPVDGGLAGLGLVALAAAAFGIVGSIFAFVWIVTLGMVFMKGGILPMLGVFAMSLVRGGYHLAAARACTKRRADVGRAARSYLIVSVIHMLWMFAMVLFVWSSGPSLSLLPALFALATFLLGWPIALWLLVNRRLMKRIFNTVSTFDVEIVPADRSVGGAGVLMTVFGALFLFIDLGMLALMAAQDVPFKGGMIVWYLALVLFALRSLIHVHWGTRALLGRMDFARFRDMTQTYLWIAFVTMLIALGGMFALEELRMAFRRAPFNMIFLAVVIASALLAWPSALRAFVQDTVPFWDADRDAERPFRPAVDRGLTALGYLHLWFAVFSFSMWLASALGMSTLMVVGEASAVDTLGLILSLGGIGLQLWVALELINMTRRYQLAAIVYSGVGVLLTLVNLIGAGDAFGQAELGGPGATIALVLSGVTSLVLPVTTFVMTRGLPPLTM